MITGESKLNNTNRQSLPPTRGRIKKNILRSMVVTFRRVMPGFGQKHSDTGSDTEGYPSSTSTGGPAPSATPRGYYSDAPSD